MTVECRRLVDRTDDRVVVDWTDLLDYYAKLGFEPWPAYDVLRREL